MKGRGPTNKRPKNGPVRVAELITKCQYCKRDIWENMVYYQHPKHGIVCERCEPFKDGGVEVPNESED